MFAPDRRTAVTSDPAPGARCRIRLASYTSTIRIQRTAVSDLAARATAALADRYRISGAVGAGGMAIVFRADDLKHDRPVAIKILKPELACSLWSARFVREIQIASRLQHPHILPLYDSGEAGGLLYYVMPFVTGESLRARLNREAPLPVADAVRLAREVADGLTHAHDIGVVHRDIKPENILLSGGHALIADFGIARAVTLAVGDTPTEPGLAIGTPLYMSPEQSSAQGDLDARSDIYSLGCMLFEMLTGEPPFRGPTALAIMAAHNTARIPALRRIRAEVPARVEAAVTRAMAKRAEQRFATAAELFAALDPSTQTPPPSSAFPAPRQSAVVVLPFANLSADPETEYLSDGISEELMQALSGIAGLRVVARTTAFALKGRREDVRDIGERLRVDLVLDGSVRVASDRIRVTAELVDTADGYRLWSARYEGRTDDTLALEDQIATAIAAVLRRRLAGETEPAASPAHTLAPVPVPPSRRPREPQAHEAYLKGRHHWNRRTELGLTRSIAWFEQAIARSPDDPAIHAALADSHLLLAIYGSVPPGEAMPKVESAAERALALDPRSAEAHTALGCVRAFHDWNWGAAEAHFRLAVELKPTYPTAHQWRAMHLLVPLSRFDEAARALAVARELDPLSPAIITSLGVLAFFRRDYAAALSALGDVLDLDPEFAAAHHFLGLTHLQLANAAEAHARLERAVSLSGRSPETVAALGWADAKLGREGAARALLDELTRRAEHGYVSPVRLAQILLGVGDRAGALDQLEQAVDQRAADLVWIGIHPVYDGVRDEPRFQDALGQLGLAGSVSTRVLLSSRPPPISA
jgi:serine/threonine-protein kinase